MTTRNLATFSTAVLLAFLTVVSAGASNLEAQDSTFQDRVGEASEGLLALVSEVIFRRYGFTLDQTMVSAPPNIRRESLWEHRGPLDQEKELGVTETRTRLIVEARPSGAATSFSLDNRPYRITLKLERQVQMDGNDEWVEIDMVEDFEDYAKGISRDFELEIRSRR